MRVIMLETEENGVKTPVFVEAQGMYYDHEEGKLFVVNSMDDSEYAVKIGEKEAISMAEEGAKNNLMNLTAYHAEWIDPNGEEFDEVDGGEG